MQWPKEKGQKDNWDWAQKMGMKSFAWEKDTFPAPLVPPFVLLLNSMYVIWYGNRVGHQYRQINTNNINPLPIKWD